MSIIKQLSIIPIIFLVSCATPRPAAEEHANKKMPLTERKEQTATVSAWEIRGAIAARHKNNGWTATLNWLQNGPSNYQLRLYGPLGGGAVKISRQGSMVTYQDGTKKESSTNAAQLLQEQTGIRLPVNNLYYWIRGLQAPGSVQSEEHDNYNHLSQLSQAGYLITYLSYTSVNGIDLPSKIKLTGHGVSIKLIIKSWKV